MAGVVRFGGKITAREGKQVRRVSSFSRGSRQYYVLDSLAKGITSMTKAIDNHILSSVSRQRPEHQ